MSFQKARLAKLSICACGFPVLTEDIPLGQEYAVDLDLRDTFTWVCGGCGTAQQVVGVFVSSRGSKRGGYLPQEIFELKLYADPQSHTP